jgi:hypothetical protein
LVACLQVIVVGATILVGCGASSTEPSQAGVSGPVQPTYPGDTAPKRDLAQWLGAGAHAAGLPPELPVMAALVESGLTNLKSGDADSPGFFRIPAPIWNKGAYAGYPERPELQLKWFIDQALAIDQRRRLAGVDTKDDATWGEWIADIERPAAQYRGRYQLRLAEARSLLRG